MGPASSSRRRIHIPAHLSDRLFLAWQIPGFRWLWASNVFTSMARILYIMAEGWLVLTITNSPFWVGLIAGIRGATLLFLSPLAGVVIDRVDRRRVLVATQLLAAAIAFVVAYLTFTDQIKLWHITIMSVLQGVVLTLNLPARWTMAMDLVGKRALLNANAANYLAFSSMLIISPTVGGIVISTAGISGVYLMVGIGFLLATAALWRIGLVPKAERQQESPWHNLKEGVAYILSNQSCRTLLLLGLMAETFGWSYQVMLPVIARDVLKVGAAGFGFLTTASGVGAMVATLFLASLGDFKAKGRMLVAGYAGFGIFLVLFAASPWFPLSMFLLAMASAMGVVYDSMLSTLLQTLAPGNMRGRIMSFYALTSGMTTIGGFQAGIIAGFLGAPVAVGIGGAAVMLNGLRVLRLMPRLQQK